MITTRLIHRRERNLSPQKTLLARVYSLITLFFLVTLSVPAFAADATLTKMNIAAKVDMSTMAPTAIATQYTDSVKEIWATVYLDSAPSGTNIAAKWYLSSQGKYEKILENQVEADGSRYVAFRIQPNEGKKLPVGDYRVDFLLNDKKIGSQSFNVAGAIASPSPASNATNSTFCSPSDENDNKLVLEIAAKHPEAKAQLAELKLMRYADPGKRFTMIVPGGWFQSEQSSPDQAIFLSQNQKNDPIAWFVVSVYNVNLTPEFGAADAINQLSGMLVTEGKKHSAEVVPNGTTGPDKLGPNMASGNLLMTYKTSEGKEIAQMHSFLVDGKYAFDIQLNAEESTLKAALFLLQLAPQSIWTEGLCGS